MNPKDQKATPGSAPGPHIKASDLPKELFLPLAATDKGTSPVKQEEDISAKMRSTSNSSPFEMKPEEQPNDGEPVATVQPHSPMDSWTWGEMMDIHDMRLTAFMDEFRAIASQERSRFFDEMQTASARQASTIDQMVQSRLDRTLARVDNMAARPLTEITELKAQLRAEKRDKRNITNEYNMLAKTSTEQREDLQTANAKLEDALHERDQLRQLLDGGTLANSNKTTDDAILSNWRQLSYNIRCLAHMLAVDPFAQHLDDVVVERLRSLTPGYRKLIKDEDYRQFIMQGYLWTFVYEEIFHVGRPIWGGPVETRFKSIRHHIIKRIGDQDLSDNGPSVPHVARWLAQGSTIMSKLWGRDYEAIKRLVNIETRHLYPFYFVRHPTVDRIDRKVWAQLKDVVDSAIEIDKMLMCSKAIFQIHWKDDSQKPNHVMRYNTDVMVSDAYENKLTPKSRVKFFVSPILYKNGTADGQRYDTRMVLAKANVVCE